MCSPQRCRRALKARPAVVSGEWDGEEVGELAVEIHGSALRVLDGADGDVRQLSQALAEQAQGDALAGAWVAGDHDEAAVGDADLDAPNEGVDLGRDVQRVEGHVGPERVELETVQTLELGVHVFSWSLARSSPSSCLMR